MINRRLLTAIFCICLLTSAQADEACVSMGPEAIIQVFDHGIALNEKFKKMVLENNLDGYAASRAQLEEFNEGKVIPCVERAAKILSSHDQSKLARKLLQLTVSYENSADETLSYSLGQIFGKNPIVIENAIRRFSSPSRQLIVDRVQVGWMSAKSGYSKDLVRDRDKWLREQSGTHHQKLKGPC